MADHIWTVLCQKPLTDPETNVLTLLEVTEHLLSEGLQEKLEQALALGKKGILLNEPMQLVSWWYRSDQQEPALNARFVLINPSGESVFAQSASVPWAKESDSLRLFIKVEKVPISAPGLYWFVVEHQRPGHSPEAWVTATRIPLHVDTAEKANAPN